MSGATISRYADDIARFVASWCRASGRPVSEAVAVHGDRATMARLVPSLPEAAADMPTTVVVGASETPDLLRAVYPEHAEHPELRTYLAAALPDGALRVLVCTPESVEYVLVRGRADVAGKPMTDLTLAEVQRRLGPHLCEHVGEVVRGSSERAVVLYVHPDMQHVAPPTQRTPTGLLLCWPAADVRSLLRGVGAERTALRLEPAPPEGTVWVVWLGYGCALVAPWPRGDAGEGALRG